jgi:hypothetical protein
LRCSGDELRRELAEHEVLPPSPLPWLVREAGDHRRMSFERSDAVAAVLAGADATLAVDVARVGWSALHRLQVAIPGSG